TAMTMSSDGVHVGYWLDSDGLFDWQPDTGSTLWFDVEARYDLPRLEGARAGRTMARLSGLTPDRYHVFRSLESGEVQDIVLADTTPFPNVIAESSPCGDAEGCAARTQVFEAAGPEHALAETADGSTWIAFQRTHVDRDVQFQQLGGACTC